MRNDQSMQLLFGTAAFLLFMAIPDPSTLQAADKTTGTSSAAPARSTVAPGSVEDSLQACLARIPKDATAGQRLIAEQGCRRDEIERQPFQSGGRG